MNTGQARYVLDAGVFIQAARHYYAFDIAPGFWQALIHHAQAGTVLSIDRVKTHEIDKGKDELKSWANREFQSWFAAAADDDVIAAYVQLMQWAYNQSQFTDAAKAEFADEGNADAWVVAYGLAKICVVVTQEKFDANIRRKVLIPNVCQAFGVQCVDTFQMLRALGVRLG